MGIPIHWTAEAKIPNLAEIHENLRLRGGLVIQYRKMHSLLLVSQIAPHFEWIESGEARGRLGREYALHNIMFGWWSPMGALGNLSIVVSNLCGGVDVTPMFRDESLVDTETQRLSVEKMLREQARDDRLNKICFWVSLPFAIAFAVALVWLLEWRDGAA